MAKMCCMLMKLFGLNLRPLLAREHTLLPLPPHILLLMYDVMNNVQGLRGSTGLGQCVCTVYRVPCTATS